MTISTERLQEMLAAAEKATPGPWKSYASVVSSETARHPDKYDPNDALPDRRAVAYCGDEFRTRMGLPIGAERDGNAAHIANCDPATIRELITELLASRSGVEGREAPHPHQAPEGMVLVPREPTKAMRAAGFEQAMDNVGGDVIGTIEVQTYITTAVWRAMIAASPSNQASASADQGGE